MLAIAIGGQRLDVRACGSCARTRRQPGRCRRRRSASAALAIAFGARPAVDDRASRLQETFQERIEESSTARRELARLDGRGRCAGRWNERRHAPRAPELRGLDNWLNTPGQTAVDRRPAREGRHRRLLDVLVHQLPADAPASEGVGRGVPRARARRSSACTRPSSRSSASPSNVRSAVRRLGLRYPVAQDNDFATWHAYATTYWPAKYLIDRTGRVRYTHFGEGAYGETESWIRRLLGEKVTDRAERRSTDGRPSEITTPESYLGYARLDRFAGPVHLRQGGRVSLPAASARRRTSSPTPAAGRVTREPSSPERTHAYGCASRRTTSSSSSRARAAWTCSSTAADRSRSPSSGLPRLYTLARFPKLKRGLLELRFSPGVEGYAFTFG